MLMKVLNADGVVGASKRHPCHRRGFQRQSAQIFGFKTMQIGFATSPRKQLGLDGQRMQEIIHPLCGRIRVKTLAQLRILCRNSPPGSGPYDSDSSTRVRPDSLRDNSTAQYPCYSSSQSAPNAQ